MNEEWRLIKDYPNYTVSSLGKVKNVEKNRLLKLKLNMYGYLEVGLYNNIMKRSRYFKVHALVLETFVCSRPPGKITRHLNGIKTHNAVSNLKWGNQKENEEDKLKHGMGQFGVDHACSKLTRDQVLYIRANYKRGSSSSALIAKELGITPEAVLRVGSRRSFKLLDRKEALEALCQTK